MIRDFDTSEKSMFPGHPEAISRWGLIWGPAAVVSSPPVGSPYELPSFWPQDNDYDTSENGDTPPFSRIVSEGGRVAGSARQGGRMELWPLFEKSSGDGGSATIQVFGFDGVQTPLSDSQEYGKLIYPIENGQLALGLAYNVLRDTTGNPQTLTVTPSSEDDQISLSILSDQNYRVVPDRYGVQYFTSPRLIFNTSGFPFWSLHVTATVGNFLCLYRTV